MHKTEGRKYFSPLNILSFGLGLALLTVLLLQVDFSSLVHSIRTIQPLYLFLGGVIYLAKSMMRSFRFWRMNAQVNPSFLRMLRLTLASSLASQLLPLKLGEFTYVYLVKKEFGSSLSSGVSSLIIIRIFDLLAISLLFSLAALGFGLPVGISIYFSYVLVFMAFLVIVLISLIAAGKYIARISHMLLQRSFASRIPQAHRLQKGLESVLTETGRIRGKELGELIAYPLLEWGVNFAMYHILLIGMGFSPRYFDTITGVSFAALASVLPVNSFGNFGTQEAGWATGLILAGFSQQAALTTGFATHLLSLVYMLLMGGAAWIAYLVSYGIAPGIGSQRSGSRSSDR